MELGVGVSICPLAVWASCVSSGSLVYTIYVTNICEVGTGLFLVGILAAVDCITECGWTVSLTSSSPAIALLSRVGRHISFDFVSTCYGILFRRMDWISSFVFACCGILPQSIGADSITHSVFTYCGILPVRA